ncbi:MAG: ATP-dependent DNA helicase RecG [Flavobacteriales bacterium]|nr:ATP-dependent DNA helicase RecG [Flavobacteriales bacterium]MCB9446883.1 ATP-dependent DNA helicase RecG [Flavobacteriales bacterium]
MENGKDTSTSSFLSTPIEYLKGVGPQRADTLKKQMQIFIFEDLLYLFPFRYIDRTRFYPVKQLHADLPYVQMKGQILSFQSVGQGRTKRLTAKFGDDTGQVDLVWFQGVKWIQEKLRKNETYILFGKPSLYKNTLNIAHPELETLDEFKNSPAGTLQAVYPSTELMKRKGLDSKGIWKLQRNLFEQIRGHIPENLPAAVRSAYHFPSREEAFRSIHFPENAEECSKAQKRLKFEELFFIQLRLLKIKTQRSLENKGIVFGHVGELFHTFYKEHLPFSLTEAQKRVIREIRQDMGSGHQMNRLLQGDVGSGKTMVALLSMLIALDNGYQAALMAPTEILAIQHANTLHRQLESMGIQTALLTGSTRKKARTEILAGIADGSIRILIGTHALLEDPVVFQKLGLVVIDEQHRFGVAQRAKLWQKGNHPPHILVMTATPIPRTLAMTLYGDLDTSVIDELPPGRKPIKTTHRYDSSRLAVFGFIRDEIAKGRQVYIVYPLIQESETQDYKDLEDGFESIQKAFPLPTYRVSIVHGKMKPADKDMEMQRFAKGETQIMVATTVIEVGVDVPNASVMVIESAERFGLSQLHQLRGRVGRGAEHSYCILMTGNKLSEDARTRIKTMVGTQDGFKVAQVDLELRGPGDLSGTQQSGMPTLKIADLVKDQNILEHARQWAGKILADDPNLATPAHQSTAEALRHHEKRNPNWSMIS